MTDEVVRALGELTEAVKGHTAKMEQFELEAQARADEQKVEQTEYRDELLVAVHAQLGHFLRENGLLDVDEE